jgi:hypothetical protein
MAGKRGDRAINRQTSQLRGYRASNSTFLLEHFQFGNSILSAQGVGAASVTCALAPADKSSEVLGNSGVQRDGNLGRDAAHPYLVLKGEAWVMVVPTQMTLATEKPKGTRRKFG